MILIIRTRVFEWHLKISTFVWHLAWRSRCYARSIKMVPKCRQLRFRKAEKFKECVIIQHKVIALNALPLVTLTPSIIPNPHASRLRVKEVKRTLFKFPNCMLFEYISFICYICLTKISIFIYEKGAVVLEHLP